MGTRHIIAVYVNGEYKIAQHGQFDGYPEHVGCEFSFDSLPTRDEFLASIEDLYEEDD